MVNNATFQNFPRPVDRTDTFWVCKPIQPAQTSQPVAEKVQEEQQRKAALPAFTYRPG
jgi:hypothetical protein